MFQMCNDQNLKNSNFTSRTLGQPKKFKTYDNRNIKDLDFQQTKTSYDNKVGTFLNK